MKPMVVVPAALARFGMPIVRAAPPRPAVWSKVRREKLERSVMLVPLNKAGRIADPGFLRNSYAMYVPNW